MKKMYREDTYKNYRQIYKFGRISLKMQRKNDDSQQTKCPQWTDRRQRTLETSDHRKEEDMIKEVCPHKSGKLRLKAFPDAFRLGELDSTGM